MKENLIFKNFINKDYFQSSLYIRDSIKLKKIIKKIFAQIENNKDTLHVLSKKFDINLNKINLKKFNKFQSVVLIGMGGSALGAEAIYYFLKPKIKKNFYFFDNLDQLKIVNVKKKLNKKSNLFIIISKSGNTLETLINSNLFEDKINCENTIIITENKKNLLSTLAKKKNILHIHHKNYIGGRYSVLSEVGMIPAHFMGLKINNFRKNLLSFFESKKKLNLIDSIVKLSHIYNSKKINSIILLNYAPELEKFLFWCQQLMAESLGKNGVGILPVISSVPRDHHSLLQLYLDGPKDKLFYIFSLKHNKEIKTNKNMFGDFFKYAANKKLSKIINAQKKAVIQTLKHRKIPYRVFEINSLDEAVLGELFSHFMLETVLVGNLIGINPFNQPSVENVKILTKKYLS